ncbi:MAG: hypothetical protein IPL63_14640 [Saprospiraceae bacterium]|nr:hypothetical protein [Saprospiraceae bacterium]
MEKLIFVFVFSSFTGSFQPMISKSEKELAFHADVMLECPKSRTSDVVCPYFCNLFYETLNKE